MIKIPKKAKVRIDGIKYNQVKANIHNINKGDLVLDTIDNCYGYIDTKSRSNVAIRYGCVVEIGVPINRIRKLVMSIENNSKN